MTKIPGVGLGVFVWKEGKFLIGRRQAGSSHGQGTWSIPGGKLDFGETWEECAKREVLEETGLQIDNVRFLAATNDIFDEGQHFVTIWLASDWVAGEPQVTEPDKMGDWRWTTFADLPSPLFEPCWRNLRAAKPELFS